VTLEVLYDVGDRPTVTATFTPNPDLAVPPDMDGHFKVRKPDHTQTTFLFTDPSVTPVDIFVWRLKLPVLDQSGDWVVYAIGSEGVEAGEKLKFTVRESVVDSPLVP